MNTKRTAGALAILALVTLGGALVVPAGAQGGPVGGALATLAAATAAADQWQQAQRQAQATRTAASYRATVSAAATSAALQAQATQAALDDLARQRAGAATATAGAYQATATAAVVQAGATSTAQAQDARATAAAYSLAYQQSKEQAALGRKLLYLAAGLALAGCAYVVMTWALATARRLDPRPAGRAFDPGPVRWEPAGAGGVVVDVTPSNLPALPGPSVRMPGQVRIVNDPDLSAKIEKWFYGGGDGSN
ncbi:MAG: hypothetical protein JW850_03945 [Thermoflexales bacterium]|nr:hypothetical protein [Thermoflexales bacterium]